MIDWKTLAFIAPLFFVIYQALSKLLPKDTSVFLVNAYASLVGFLIMITLHLLTSSNKTMFLSTKTFLLSIAIGALIGIGNFAIIKAYTLGAPQSLFTLLFYISLIIYGIIFGLFIWHDKLHALQIIGITLSLIGVAMTIYFKK